MPKAIINLADVLFDDIEDNGYYTSRRAMFSASIGARQLGYNLTELPPGKAQCPFHAHSAEEEVFVILEGEGELRFGDQRYPLRPHDVVACPTGGPEVAHQIINTGRVPMRYLALSNQAELEVCEYRLGQDRRDGQYVGGAAAAGPAPSQRSGGRLRRRMH